jgi:hypothetical protein
VEGGAGTVRLTYGQDGVVEQKAISCPVCLGESAALTGMNNEGRTLALFFTCTCSAMFVHEYYRQAGGATLLSVKMAPEQRFDPA